MRVRISTEADRASALMHPGIRGRDALSMSVNTPWSSRWTATSHARWA